MCKSISSSNHPPKMKLYRILLFLFFNTLFLKSFSSKNSKYHDCSGTFKCGSLEELDYPFYDGSTRPEYCGHPGFKLDCSQGIPHPHITISDQVYNLIGAADSHIITVSRNDTWTNSCPDRLTNTTIDFSKFSLSPSNHIITFFYACEGSTVDLSPLALNKSTCDLGGYGSLDGYYLTQEMVDQHKILFQNCKSNIFLPVSGSGVEAVDGNLGNLGNLITAFEAGFDLRLIANDAACSSCIGSNGVCGWGSQNFVCHCDDADYNLKCGVGSPLDQGSNHKTSIAIGVSIGVVALLGGCFVLAYRRRSQLMASQKARGIHPSSGTSSNGGAPLVAGPMSNGLTSYTTTPSTTLSQTTPSYATSRSDVSRDKTCYFGVHVFDYTELEHATCNFHDSKELGDGGFGTVYYGVLPDGRQVAVKRLYENSFKRVEQFMNEIRILAELHHKNLVALYGCTSRRSRELLLVYEYVSNGTVADHIHGKLADSTFVPWLIRLNIAIETAEALAFLHRNVVIHRDVKTTNILLDNEFHVKVADFGLSRLFPLDMTHVSTAPQGTPGYVDPEYYQCYKLTEKSDVYSFGVVLIELISSKHAVDITRHRHHVNLASMALDWIQSQELHKLVDPRLGFDKDHSTQATIKMVGELGFRCLQQDRDMRPTMDEVLASLRAIQLEGLKAQKQEIVDIIVYGDDVGLLTSPTPPLSPEFPRSNDVV